MATIHLTYRGSLRTESEHLQSGTRLITDAPCDNRGKGESFSPTDTVASALGSCMLTIMGIRAQDNGIDISGAEASVTKIMASDPRRISRIEIEIQMPSDKNYTEAEKELLVEAGLNCPVCKSLSPDLEKVINFHW